MNRSARFDAHITFSISNQRLLSKKHRTTESFFSRAVVIFSVNQTTIIRANKVHFAPTDSFFNTTSTVKMEDIEIRLKNNAKIIFSRYLIYELARNKTTHFRGNFKSFNKLAISCGLRTLLSVGNQPEHNAYSAVRKVLIFPSDLLFMRARISSSQLSAIEPTRSQISSAFPRQMSKPSGVAGNCE